MKAGSPAIAGSPWKSPPEDPSAVPPAGHTQKGVSAALGCSRVFVHLPLCLVYDALGGLDPALSGALGPTPGFDSQ